MTDASLVRLVIEALEDVAGCSRDDLAEAPLIEDWVVSGADAPCLVGRVVGHPILSDGRVRTSLLIAISVEEGWARTLNRFYRLGSPLGKGSSSMTAAPTHLFGRIAHRVSSANTAGLLASHARERLMACGAQTMTLLGISTDLRGTAGSARLERDQERASAADAHADDFIKLGLRLMRAGDWHVTLGAADRDAVARWARAAARIGRDIEEARHGRRPHMEAPGNRVEFNLSAGIALVRIDVSALVDQWRASVVDAPTRRDHGWPIVTGRIYGDPRLEDGKAVSLYGLPAPDERTMRGLHMTYALGRKAKASS